MAIHGSKRGGQQNRADHDQNHGIRVAEVKITTAHLLQKEKHADGDDHRRAQQSANRASRAAAPDSITHGMYLSKASA
jgi:hypothetical protein